MQPVATEDQVRLIRCDGRVIGIQNIAATERERLRAIILAVSIGCPIETPRRILAWWVVEQVK